MKRIGLLLLAFTLFVGANAAKTSINVDSLKDEIIRSTEKVQRENKDSVMYSKLSADQIMQLKKGEQDLEKKRIESDGVPQMPLPSIIILLICALPFIFVATIIIVNVRSRNEESKRRYDLYVKSIENGQTVPENFFDEPKRTGASNLKRGVIWLAIGLGVVVSFLIIHESKGLILGIIPAFVGAGFLLVHFLDKPKQTEQ